jgi:TRAP-type mannitol/chloroaromatic compound transport system permease large subunit
MLGTIAAVILLLESTIAVVVLQSSLGLCDVADLIAQLLSDSLFLSKLQYNYVSLAAGVTKNNLLSMAKVAKQLEDKREPVTEHRLFYKYIGRYENAIKN